MAKYFSLIICIVLIYGCAVGPNYTKPSKEQLIIPESWHGELPHGGTESQLIDWWGQFNDPYLPYLIKNALQTNPTIFIAIAKIKEAQAALQATRSFLYPTVTAIGNAGVTQNSMMSFSTGSTTGNGSAGNFFSSTGLSNGASGGANMSWELDLFGATRKSIEASLARYQATQLDWNDAKVSLAAQVADVYISVRECQNLLQIYQEESKSRQATQKITKIRVDTGFSAAMDNKQTLGSLYNNVAVLQKQQSICEQLVNQLTALTGINYKQLTNKLTINYGKIPSPTSILIVNIPANIINQRPDVASAEKSLSAANADIGVATANRYPQIFITGSITANAGSLYGGQSASWSLGPAVSIPITDGGYLKAQESISYAKYEEAYANYRNKVINAVKEVENALARVSLSSKQVLAAESSESNYQQYFTAYNTKYNTGWANLLELEVARINYLSSREILAAAKLEQAQAWIALYKSVGGDWNNESNNSMVNPSTPKFN